MRFHPPVRFELSVLFVSISVLPQNATVSRCLALLLDVCTVCRKLEYLNAPSFFSPLRLLRYLHLFTYRLRSLIARALALRLLSSFPPGDTVLSNLVWISTLWVVSRVLVYHTFLAVIFVVLRDCGPPDRRVRLGRTPFIPTTVREGVLFPTEETLSEWPFQIVSFHGLFMVKLFIYAGPQAFRAERAGAGVPATNLNEVLDNDDADLVAILGIHLPQRIRFSRLHNSAGALSTVVSRNTGDLLILEHGTLLLGDALKCAYLDTPVRCALLMKMRARRCASE